MNSESKIKGKKNSTGKHSHTAHHHKHEHVGKNNTQKADGYYCPMKCEGDKVYNEPGNCPVCGMHLIPVDENYYKSGGEHHQHKNHDEHEHEHHHHNVTEKSTGKGKYYCPMRCEGDKMYDEPGDCPVCNMHLAPAE